MESKRKSCLLLCGLLLISGVPLFGVEYPVPDATRYSNVLQTTLSSAGLLPSTRFNPAVLGRGNPAALGAADGVLIGVTALLEHRASMGDATWARVAPGLPQSGFGMAAWGDFRLGYAWQQRENEKYDAGRGTFLITPPDGTVQELPVDPVFLSEKTLFQHAFLVAQTDITLLTLPGRFEWGVQWNQVQAKVRTYGAYLPEGDTQVRYHDSRGQQWASNFRLGIRYRYQFSAKQRLMLGLFYETPLSYGNLGSSPTNTTTIRGELPAEFGVGGMFSFNSAWWVGVDVNRLGHVQTQYGGRQTHATRLSTSVGWKPATPLTVMAGMYREWSQYATFGGYGQEHQFFLVAGLQYRVGPLQFDVGVATNQWWAGEFDGYQIGKLGLSWYIIPS